MRRLNLRDAAAGTALLLLVAVTAPAQQAPVYPHTRAHDDGEYWIAGGDFVTLSHNYEEPGIMEEDGALSGFAPALGFRSHRWLVRLEGVFPAAGDVQYVGSAYDLEGDSIIPLEVSGIPDRIRKVELEVGWVGRLSEVNAIVPYTGVGLRYLTDNLSNHPAGYLRQSLYYYSPIGLQLEYQVAPPRWFLDLTAEYKHLWIGKQKSNLSGVSSVLRLPDVTNTQKDGHGLAASLALRRSHWRGEAVLRFFVESWDIGQSDLVRATGFYTGAEPPLPVELIFFEPANNTTQFGITVGYRFFFSGH